MSVDQIRKTFEAGFKAAWWECGELFGEHYDKKLQHAWKKFCGIDT